MEFIPTKLGVALIEGFDRMNFETSLGKPFLRKEMELKMRAICDGRTTKEVVLQESIRQYRHVYMQSQEKLDVLKSVSHTRRTKLRFIDSASACIISNRITRHAESTYSIIPSSRRGDRIITNSHGPVNTRVRATVLFVARQNDPNQ